MGPKTRLPHGCMLDCFGRINGRSSQMPVADAIDEIVARIVCLEVSVFTLINRVDETQRRAFQQEMLKIVEDQDLDDAQRALAIAAVNRLFPT